MAKRQKSKMRQKAAAPAAYKERNSDLHGILSLALILIMVAIVIVEGVLFAVYGGDLLAAIVDPSLRASAQATVTERVTPRETNAPAVQPTYEPVDEPAPEPTSEPTSEPSGPTSDIVTPEPVPVATTAPSTQQGTLVGSAESKDKVYHESSCRYVGQINADNIIWFADADAAAQQGYRACEECG